MEHLWSPAGASSGKRTQMGHAQKPLKQADPQPVATHGNRFGAHGKGRPSTCYGGGHLACSAKENEPREPEGPRDSMGTLSAGFVRRERCCPILRRGESP